MVCAASTRNRVFDSLAIWPISLIFWSVPETFEPCPMAMSFVFSVIAFLMSCGFTRPVMGWQGIRVYVMFSCFCSSFSGRRMELWSSAVVMTWSPDLSTPRIAIFSASVVFSVKMTWLGSDPPMSVLIRERQVFRRSPACCAWRYAPLPGLAPSSWAK